MRRAIALSAWTLLTACGLEPAPSPGGSDSAQSLGVFSPEQPSDKIEQTRLALQQDAFRREARFFDAAEPGYLWAASRPDQEAIEAGAHDTAALFAIGAQLFHHQYTVDQGLGGADAPYPRRVHSGFRGGPEALSCRTCHWRGGIAGAGDAADNAYLQGDGDTPGSALERNPPSLAGAGVVELLGREITASLATQRLILLEKAMATGAPAQAPLAAKGISFGVLTVKPDGSIDAAGLTGIGADLVVRPFGRKGTFASLRDVVEDELSTHHGMQSTSLVASASDLEARVGPFGGADPDGDGVESEITEGQVTTLTLFLAMQAVPVVELPNTPFTPITSWATGRERFEDIGCASCHVPRLSLQTASFSLPSRDGGTDVVVDLERDGAEPRISRSVESGGFDVNLFSDLKRHDMGEALADARDDRGVDKSSFMTPPLWGLARSRPYLHDGRAQTLHEAITFHGGEASDARDAYVALGEAGQAPIRVFLTSLARGPAYVAH